MVKIHPNEYELRIREKGSPFLNMVNYLRWSRPPEDIVISNSPHTLRREVIPRFAVRGLTSKNELRLVYIWVHGHEANLRVPVPQSAVVAVNGDSLEPGS